MANVSFDLVLNLHSPVLATRSSCSSRMREKDELKASEYLVRKQWGKLRYSQEEHVWERRDTRASVGRRLRGESTGIILIIVIWINNRTRTDGRPTIRKQNSVTGRQDELLFLHYASLYSCYSLFLQEGCTK
jgi:hypothetical protein